jgi:hypothetical protein
MCVSKFLVSSQNYRSMKGGRKSTYTFLSENLNYMGFSNKSKADEK